MAVATEVGHFTKATATGDQDITIATDLTGAAAGTWAVIFWSTGTLAASGTLSTGDVFALIGFTVGASESGCSACYIDDGAATMQTSRGSGTECIMMPSITGAATLWEADFVSFPTSTTMRINWTVNDGTNNTKIAYMIISGLTDAAVVDWAMPTSATSKAVTGVGFQPDAVIHAFARTTASAATHANAVLSLGIHNAAGEQWSNSIVSVDNIASANTSRWQRTDSCLVGVSTSELQAERATHTSMDSDGFTVNFATKSDASDYHVKSLCLKGVDVKIGSFNSSTTVGASTQTVTHNHGKTSRGVLVSSFGGGATTTPAGNAIWSLGGSDGTNERLQLVSDNDGAGTSVADCMHYTDKGIGVFTLSGSVYAVGDLSLNNVNSFDVGWTTNGGVAMQYLYAVFADGAAGPTNLVVQDATHAHTVDNLALTQAHTLVVADAAHAHSADNLALTQAHTLVVADASHAHAVDNIVLTQAHVLAIADASHGHASDNLVLTQVHTLAINDATHGHTADNITLGENVALIVADALHAHSVDNITLTQAHILTIADALHNHLSDNITLTQAHTIVIADATHAHSADNIVVTTVVVTGINGTVLVEIYAPKIRLNTTATASIELRAYTPKVRMGSTGDTL